jgi:hypothetical protein
VLARRSECCRPASRLTTRPNGGARRRAPPGAGRWRTNWREAQRQIDERCSAAVEHLDSEAFHRLFEAEQAKVDAIRAEIDAVLKHDKWPRELYWGGI